MSEIKSVIVLDCSGSLGMQILQKAAYEDLHVTAYTNSPQAIPEHIASKLSCTIQGDILDRQKVEQALQGHDAVLCAIESFSWRGHNKAISEGCRNVINGMKKHGMKRLVIASNGIALPRRSSFYDNFIKRWGANGEYIRMMAILENEKASIDWVAMMLPKITTSKKVNPDYKVERNNMPGQWSVTTGEVADFMVKVFMDKASTECFKHNKLGISSHPKPPSYISIKNVTITTVVAIFGAMVYYRLLPPVLQQYLDEVIGNDPITN